MKWEYDISVELGPINTTKKAESLVEFLDEKSRLGWELISVDNGVHYFKRPLTEEVQSKEVD